MQEMPRWEIEQMLDNALIGRLSMADRTGRPYTIPLPFCWYEGTIYLRLPLTGRKGDVLGENDQVCFEVDRFSQTLDEYASVLVEGRLVEVCDLNEKAAVKRLNEEKYDRLRRGHRPGHGRSTALASLPMRKMVETRISGRMKQSAPVLAAAR